MKILSLTNTPLDLALGSGKTVIAWSQGLRDLGHEVDVFPPQSFYHPWPRDSGKRIKMRIDAKCLAETILANKYDLVEFYGAEFGLLVDKLSRVNRDSRPLLVAHTNGLELLASESVVKTNSNLNTSTLQSIGASILHPVIARIDRLAFAKVDAFAAICEADKNYVVNHKIQAIERCAVVEPGVDQVFLSSLWHRPKKQILLSFASWTSRKDPQTLVRVVTTLLTQILDLEFHVVGASGYKQEILSAFPEHLQSRIVVYPRLSQIDISDVLTQAKVFLFPSLYEGFGMATTEAMACGCAVVVTPTGFGETIRDGVDGFLCNFQDVDMITARCSLLFADDELRQRLITAARERIMNFSWPSQVQKLELQYKQWVQTL